MAETAGITIQEICAIVIAAVAVVGFTWNRMAAYAKKNEEAHAAINNRITESERHLGNKIDGLKDALIAAFVKPPDNK